MSQKDIMKYTNPEYWKWLQEQQRQKQQKQKEQQDIQRQQEKSQAETESEEKPLKSLSMKASSIAGLLVIAVLCGSLFTYVFVSAAGEKTVTEDNIDNLGTDSTVELNYPADD